MFGASGRIFNTANLRYVVTQGTDTSALGPIYGFVDADVASFLATSAMGSINNNLFDGIVIKALFANDGVTDGLEVWLEGNVADSVVNNIIGQGLTLYPPALDLGYEATPDATRFVVLIDTPVGTPWDGTGDVWAEII